MENEFWNAQPAKATDGKRASGVFQSKKMNAAKTMTPIISRAEKLKNFKYMA